MGKLAKTDKIDAKCLALMAATVMPQAVAPRPELMENLHELMRTCQALADERTAFLNRIAACALAFVKREFGGCS